MKTCSKCGEEIYTRDGENMCSECEDGKKRKKKNSLSRKTRESILSDLGLKKVRGAMGGVYWE